MLWIRGKYIGESKLGASEAVTWARFIEMLSGRVTGWLNT